MSIEAMKQMVDALAALVKRAEPYGEQDWLDGANAIDAGRAAIAEAEKHGRHELQAKGKHPSPCARFCEANAFQVEIRALEAELARRAQQTTAPEHTTKPAEKQGPPPCRHSRYSIDVREQTGTCCFCGAEGRMKFVVDDAVTSNASEHPKREPLTDAHLYLESLVDALDGALISSWQSTAAWQTQLDEARDYLAAHGIKGAA